MQKNLKQKIMNWFILFGIIFVVGIIFFACRNLVDYDWDDFFSAIGLTGIVLGAGLFVGLLITTAGVKADFERFENRYNFDKQLIENYTPGDDYGNVFNLTEEILFVNKTIAKHKAYWDNGWYDVWNCERIGNLEPLSLPKKTQNN